MFIIYSGYSSPDRCTDNDEAVCDLDLVNTEEEVIAHKKEFDEQIYDECRDITYRIFKGTEYFLKPIEKITKHKLTPLNKGEADGKPTN